MLAEGWEAPLDEAFAQIVSLEERLALVESDFAYLYAALYGGPVPDLTLPTITTAPSITSDGTPQVGETLTGVAGVYVNGTVQAQAWLSGATVLATTQTYVPTVTGTLVYRESVTGPGGTILAVSTSITITAAEPLPITNGVTYANDNSVYANDTTRYANGTGD